MHNFEGIYSIISSVHLNLYPVENPSGSKAKMDYSEI